MSLSLISDDWKNKDSDYINNIKKGIRIMNAKSDVGWNDESENSIIISLEYDAFKIPHFLKRHLLKKCLLK